MSRNLANSSLGKYYIFLKKEFNEIEGNLRAENARLVGDEKVEFTQCCSKEPPTIAMRSRSTQRDTKRDTDSTHSSLKFLGRSSFKNSNHIRMSYCSCSPLFYFGHSLSKTVDKIIID